VYLPLTVIIYSAPLPKICLKIEELYYELFLGF
jgi:hypothetical protein